jgi:hypothetical protein
MEAEGFTRARRRRATGADPAFDLWLDGGLRAMYDDVTKEPIPPEILKALHDPQGPP